jgi:hypothetical protein
MRRVGLEQHHEPAPAPAARARLAAVQRTAGNRAVASLLRYPEAQARERGRETHGGRKTLEQDVQMIRSRRCSRSRS